MNKGGSHIHITSVRSNLGIRRGYAAYCASKGGLGILIKQLATEWAPYGIRVNGIAPTFTRTPLVEDYLNDPDFYNALVQRIPLGRVCETVIWQASRSSWLQRLQHLSQGKTYSWMVVSLPPSSAYNAW